MNKEPIALYIFRFVLGAALLLFVAMLYWSNTLIETDLKIIRSDVTEIKEDIRQIKQESGKIRDDLVERESDHHTAKTALAQPFGNSQSDGTNLLSVDPFFTKIFPGILPKNFKPTGTFRRATIGKPHNLHPFSEWSHIAEWNDLCSVSAAKMLFGKYETMAPDMALKIEERKIGDTEASEFWIYLRDRVFWEPLNKSFFPGMNIAPFFLQKHQVTAEDFKFYFDAVMNPYVQEPGAIALRNYLGDIVEIRIIDKLTLVVRWKSEKIKEPDGKEQEKIKYIARQWTGNLKPLASFVYKYFPDGKKIVEDDSNPETYRTNSVWAQNFSQHWAKNVIPSCGPWLFNGMSEREIRFRRNPDFYEPLAATAENIVIAFKSSPDAIWQSFKTGELDSYAIQPDQLMELDEYLNSPYYISQADKKNSIERIDYPGRTYSYIGWNMAKPFFTSKKVRQAMTMAIDRQRIIAQNLNGTGKEITGTFYIHSDAYDSSIEPWPFDPLQAKNILEEEGWYDTTGTGVINKMIDGKKVPFEFSLTYYVKNPLAKAIGEYIATALKEIGVICNLNGVDIADLSAKFEEKNFDAIFLGWSLGTPPEDPRQLWYSTGAKEQGSSNAVGFADKEVDKIIDSLSYEYDREKRIALYRRFDAIIHEEQPYTFLYTPNTTFLYRSYLQNVFIPADRQDLIPGANVSEPDQNIFWIKKFE